MSRCIPPGIIPDNAPAECPRRREGGYGPRRCDLSACASHLHSGGSRGPAPRGDRVRLVVLSADTCVRDVVARARRDGVELTQADVAERLGISRQAANSIEKRALAKLRRLLRVRST